MRILFLAPKKKGGPHLSLLMLQKELQDLGNEVDFYASIKGYIKAIFTRKYDIIHSVLPVPFNLFGTPVVLNVRGNYKVEKGFRNPLGYLYPVAIWNAAKIVFPSRFMRNEIGIKDCVVIPNFVNDKTFSFEKKSYRIGKVLKIGMISKFHFEQKAGSVLDLLEILSELKYSGKIELHIAGAGVFLEDVKKKSEGFNLKNVEIFWYGFVKENYKFVENLDICTYWSNLDNFPNAVLEAMAIGLPVITNDIGAVREFVVDKKTGYICDKKNYVNVLNKLIKDKGLREKIGKNARAEVEKNFSSIRLLKNF